MLYALLSGRALLIDWPEIGGFSGDSYAPYLLHRNLHRFRGGLVFKAHRLLYYSTLGLRVIRKKKKFAVWG